MCTPPDRLAADRRELAAKLAVLVKAMHPEGVITRAVADDGVTRQALGQLRNHRGEVHAAVLGVRRRRPAEGIQIAAKLGEPELERREMMDTRRDAVEVAAHNVDLDRVQVAGRHRGGEIGGLAEG